ncbi:MAG TPA: LytTR family DNA-binding domain-containing protein [Steroidobacteraceae bacterium]|jgi:two-component system LytT family response regulator|nr:LytTR family DNA-binding domain-containing protein [Steroidobacteraceae bacterium]
MKSAGTRAEWSALIVDDEPLARASLRALLERESEPIAILEARNGPEAVSLICDQRPDVVFLDVQMPEMDGFDVLRRVGAAAMPAVIFVTAHDRFAIQAFEINALDYLLKPVSGERFAEALQRARSHRQPRGADSERIVSLLQTLTSPPQTLTRIAVRSAGKTRFVNLADVLWIQAAENYVQLHTATSRHLVHTTMQALLGRLDARVFARIHRSIIVNVRHVAQVASAEQGDYVLTLDNGACIRSSRTYSDTIRKWVSNRP